MDLVDVRARDDVAQEPVQLADVSLVSRAATPVRPVVDGVDPDIGQEGSVVVGHRGQKESRLQLFQHGPESAFEPAEVPALAPCPQQFVE